MLFLSYFLEFELLGYVRLFIIDRSSHVRPLQHSHDSTTFPNQMFIEVGSIAIWNRNKVVMTIAISMWGSYLMFLVQSKLLLPLPWVI